MVGVSGAGSSDFIIKNIKGVADTTDETKKLLATGDSPKTEQKKDGFFVAADSVKANEKTEDIEKTIKDIMSLSSKSPKDSPADQKLLKALFEKYYGLEPAKNPLTPKFQAALKAEYLQSSLELAEKENTLATLNPKDAADRNIYAAISKRMAELKSKVKLTSDFLNPPQTPKP